MSSFGDQIKSALTFAVLSSLYGIASLVIWFGGEALGFGIAARLSGIVILILTWPLAFVLRRRAKKPDAENQAAPAASEAEAKPLAGKKTPPPPASAFDELTRNAEEAVQWLRNRRIYGAKSKDALYKLPWFFVAGPPSSGKTSLLFASEFNFQTLPRQRSTELSSVRPTRHCEWRIADEAVFLDTAGRYQNDGPAREEWKALVEIVGKHRKARPLDGFLAIVSADKLLHGMTEGEIEQQAKTLRARLDVLAEQVQMRFPVYLVFTHTDMMLGFGEFFTASTNAKGEAHEEGREEVWGITIPLEKSENAQALFDAEFDYLYESLMRQRLARLDAPATPERQLRTFDFPLLFGDARNKLGLYISHLFRPNPFSASPLMRGFYFTGIVKDAGAKTGATRESAESNGGGSSPPPPREPFFAAKFFREVLLADKDLAATFLATERRVAPVSKALIVALAALLLLLSMGTLVSFFKNRAFVADAVARGALVNKITRDDAGRDPLTKDPAQTRKELEAADSLRETLKTLEDYRDNAPPLLMRFGLYSGDSIYPSLRAIYFDLIEQRYAKPTVRLLERDLRAFTAGTPANQSDTPAAQANIKSPATVTATAKALPAKPATAANAATTNAAATTAETITPPVASEEELGRNYDRLKAYLMLADATKAEPTFLDAQLIEYWKRSAPDSEIISQQQLEYYATQLSDPQAPHIKVDDRLVADARSKLIAYPAVNRFYKRITTEVNLKVRAVSLDTILEGSGRGVLTGTHTVPGSFTLEGYREYMREALETAAREISKDDWVMGAASGASAKNASADTGKLQKMYFNEYTGQWREFVKGISVRDYRTKADAVETLAIMSKSDSPLERVVLAVEYHTNLSSKNQSGGIINWFKNLFSRQRNAGTDGASEPEREFRPLFDFVSTEGKKENASALAQYRATLGQVHDPLEGASQTQLDQTAKTLMTGQDEIGLQKAEQTVVALLDNFKQTAAGGDVAALLKQPLDNLRALLYGSGYAQIQKIWREQIYPKAHTLESGFPFAETGETSVADLSRFLNPENGQFTTFFNNQLADSFDDVEGEWKLKESGAFKYSKEFVKYLNDARRLREALFPNGGAQPAVGYVLELQPATDADVIFEIDGQRIETGRATPAPFLWPPQGGAATGAVIKLLPKAEKAEIPTPLAFTGEWGVLKMFAEGNPNKTGDKQFALTWKLGAASVHATLRTASSSHPFQLNLFAKMRAPRSL